jgi:hypothetical protein
MGTVITGALVGAADPPGGSEETIMTSASATSSGTATVAEPSARGTNSDAVGSGTPPWGWIHTW